MNERAEHILLQIKSWELIRETAHTVWHRMSFFQKLRYGRSFQRKYDEACERIHELKKEGE
jgi:hypothetical protein